MVIGQSECSTNTRIRKLLPKLAGSVNSLKRILTQEGNVSSTLVDLVVAKQY